MDWTHDSEDIMALTKKDADHDDVSKAAQVLSEETDEPVDEFVADTEEYPHPHPSDVETDDLRDGE